MISYYKTHPFHGALPRELYLALAHFEEVATPLHKGVDLGEDGGLVKVPVLRRVRVVVRHGLGGFSVDLLPLFAAENRLGEVLPK